MASSDIKAELDNIQDILIKQPNVDGKKIADHLSKWKNAKNAKIGSAKDYTKAIELALQAARIDAEILFNFISYQDVLLNDDLKLTADEKKSQASEFAKKYTKSWVDAEKIHKQFREEHLKFGGESGLKKDKKKEKAAEQDEELTKVAKAAAEKMTW